MTRYLKWLSIPILGGVHLLWGGTLSTLWLVEQPWLDIVPNLTRDVSIGLVIGLLYVGLSRLVIQYTDWGRALEDELLSLLRTRDRSPLQDAFASSLIEEMAFRAVLLNYVSLWSGAALFALFHFPTRLGLIPWMLSAFFMGMVFGALFLAGFSLAAPVTAHFAINYLNLHYLDRRQPQH